MYDADRALAASRPDAGAAFPLLQAEDSTMSTVAKAVETPRTVVQCYDFLDRFLPECGIWDLTDGLYHGDPRTPHEQAQQKQVEWLLDQVHCERGSRILEIGCGNGRLLRTAGARGAEAIAGMYHASTRKYPDGTPRSKHVITNPIVEVADDGLTATVRSYYTVFQQVDGDFPLQPVINGRYRDEFTKVDGEWRYTRRHMGVEYLGDLSRHLLFEL